MARQIQCPYCNGSVLSNKVARTFSSISGFFSRTFNVNLPTGLLDTLSGSGPVSKKALRKGECKVCNGKGTIPDPSDDQERYQKSLAIAQEKSARILELENALAPACGNRYTIIQGHELLEVGIGINDAPSYRVDKEKSIANWGLEDMANINVKEGGSIPRGAKRNHVQGINPLPTPGGHYTIKCANKLSIITGAQGVDITTGGPLVISGGITRITGPEITIGTQTGRLALEGETVNLNGKSVEVAPTDGHFFVKGTISNTGNIMCAGHGHMESASVVNLSLPGKNASTNPSAPTDGKTGPAVWSGMAVAGAVKDLAAFVLANTSHPKLAQNIAMPRFMLGLQEKMEAIAYASMPFEMVPTGLVFGVQAGSGVLPIFNFPHTHKLPDLIHAHDIRVPNIDISADDAGGVRAKAAGASSPAPKYTSTSATAKSEAIKSLVTGTAGPAVAALTS